MQAPLNETFVSNFSVNCNRRVKIFDYRYSIFIYYEILNILSLFLNDFIKGQDEIRQALKVESDQLAAELEAERSQHMKELARQQALADRELERLRSQLSDRSASLKSLFHKELKEEQEAGQRRLMDMKRSHLQAIETIRKEHDQQVITILIYSAVSNKS